MKHRLLTILIVAALAIGWWGALPMKKAKAAGPYYSKSAATNFSTLADWGTNTDGSGTAPAVIDNTSDFIVANGATLTTLGGSVTVRNLTINSGSALIFDGANTLTANGAGGGGVTVSGNLTAAGSVTPQLSAVNLTITTGGIITNSTAAADAISISGVFALNDGGTYIHNTNHSTKIGASRVFGNASNYEYRNCSSFATTLPYGNLRINAGSCTPDVSTWSIKGTLRISSGTFNQQSITTGTLTLGGGLLIDGGAFVSSKGEGVGTLAFGTNGVNGGTLQITSGSANFQNIAINSGRTVGLLSDITIPADRSLVVSGTLNTGTKAVTGAGALTLTSGATLGIGSPEGIHTGTSLGNIQVSGTRTYHAGANYVFNGSGSQVLGDGFPITLNNLTINPGALVDISTPALTVNGTVTNHGTLREIKTVNAAATSFLNISTNKYYGVEIDPGTNNLGSTTVDVSGNQIPPLSNGFPVSRSFSITPTGAGPLTATIKFYYLQSEMQIGQSYSGLNIWHYGNGTWESPAVTRVGDSGSCNVGALDCYVQGSGIDHYSPFALKQTSPNAVNLASFSAAKTGDHTTLTWETASELHNLGFNVWRGASASHPTEKLNDGVIPSQAPGGTSGFTYTYADASATSGPIYYWLEDIDLNGTVTRHGPVTVVAAGAPSAVRLVSLTATTPAAASWLLLGAGLLAIAGAGAISVRRRL